MNFIPKNKEFDLIGLGEVMLRLSPPNAEKISQGETFDKNAGGSELNVASGAAQLGLRSAIVTKIPEIKSDILSVTKSVTATSATIISYTIPRRPRGWAFTITRQVHIRVNPPSSMTALPLL